MYIYKIQNNVNDKCYVGRTKNFKERIKEHKKKRSYMYPFFEEFGINNFSFEILEETDDINKLYELEKKYIKELNSLVPNGYNRSKGGKSTLGFKHSDKTKMIISRKKKGTMKGSKNPYFGRSHSEETRNKMKAAWERREVTEQMLLNCRIGTEKVKKPVICIETSEEFDCVQSAANKYSVAATNISRACRNSNRTAAKLHWKYKTTS